MKNFLAVFDTKDNNCYAFSFIFFLLLLLLLESMYTDLMRLQTTSWDRKKALMLAIVERVFCLESRYLF